MKLSADLLWLFLGSHPALLLHLEVILVKEFWVVHMFHQTNCELLVRTAHQVMLLYWSLRSGEIVTQGN